MEGPAILLLILGIVAAAGIGLAIAVGVARRRRRLAIEARGWHREGSADVSVTSGLNLPPFGLGLSRALGERIFGASNGVPFQVLDYRVGDVRDFSRVRAVVMRLPAPVPELALAATPTPRAPAAAPQPAVGPWQVRCDDAAYAAAFQQSAGGALQALAAGLGETPLDLTLDGDQLVVLGASNELAKLDAMLPAVAAVARAVPAAAVPVPVPPPYPSFYRRPTWEFRDRDDAMLAHVSVTGGGQAHTARKVVLGHDRPFGFIALEHHWQTTRTETSTDANGNTTTRTVTDNHVEHVFELLLPGPMPRLRVARDSKLRRMFSGRHVDFESAQFNAEYDVFADDPKFASDVITPRMMEYLLATRPVFDIEGGRLRVQLGDYDVGALVNLMAVLYGVLQRVPEFVWQNLGLPTPDFDLDGRPGPTFDQQQLS